MMLLYWERLQKRKLKELRLNAVLWGAKISLPDDDEDEEQRYEYAVRKSRDPLMDFPHDVVYFTAEQCDRKISVTRALGAKLPPEKRWDHYRKEACLGKFGIVARRCSMNDRLWSVWLRTLETGARLGLDEVKRMILVDLKRSELYPPGWRDDTAEPPPWYLEELKRTGKYGRIMKELDELARGR